MKRTIYLFFVVMIFATTFSSCRQYYAVRQAGDIAGGRNTSFSKTYEFEKNNIVVDNPLEVIESYFEKHSWNVSAESDNSVSFEFVESPLANDTVSKTAHGTARFTESGDEIQMYMSLRGNYGFGTKKHSDKFYNDLKELLYSREN